MPPINITRRFAILSAAAATAAAAAKNPVVTLTTRLGDIRILVNTQAAPISANDFLRYVRDGAWNGGRFFRTVRAANDHGSPKIDVIQGGARQGAKIRAPIAHETTAQTGLRHLDGTVSLPRDAPGSATGAEIFICIGAQKALDFGGMRNKDGQGFAAFGQVIEGMEIVRRIWAMDVSAGSDDPYTAGQMLRVPVEILSARLT
jgi:peptidyl-prolyl cis-trans isomerase A (cyclophilin A)